MINHSRLRQVTIEDLQGLPGGYEGDRRAVDMLDQALALGEKLRSFIRLELLPARPAIYEQLQRIMARHERHSNGSDDSRIVNKVPAARGRVRATRP